ncbi:hypothetical protein H5410_012790 [Solanum commersonii]|uniref:Uncharacterized protein n=1 Tax=Solanum commersonii TaxID=4109 RepID=A0A9J6AT51_SOLCO|nr:hypothetical protein H5410_012790 [Solanum commersonii]
MKEKEFVFNDVSERSTPSILRGFSAPIRLESDLTDRDLHLLLAHDSDEFNRIMSCGRKYSEMKDEIEACKVQMDLMEGSTSSSKPEGSSSAKKKKKVLKVDIDQIKKKNEELFEGNGGN